MSLLLASCGSATIDTADVESVGDNSADTPAVADESAPVESEALPSRDSREMECDGRPMESAIIDFGLPIEPSADGNTVEAAAARFMSHENPSWQLRRDWQRLMLDQQLSTTDQYVYVEADGSPYLTINFEQLSGVWVLSGWASCAPAEDDLAALDDDFVPIPSNGVLPFHQRLECAGNLLSMEFLQWLPVADGRDFQMMRDAIDPFLESGEGGQWPQDAEWRVAHADEDSREAPKATLVARADDGFAWMNLAMTNGEWRWSGSSIGGDCELHVVIENRSTVEWEVIESSPQSSIVRVRANERGCASGQAMGDRLRDPVVTLTPEVAYILLVADLPLGEFQECPGNPSVDVEVELSEPLGDREVRNTQTSLGWFSEHWPDQ